MWKCDENLMQCAQKRISIFKYPTSHCPEKTIKIQARAPSKLYYLRCGNDTRGLPKVFESHLISGDVFGSGLPRKHVHRNVDKKCNKYQNKISHFT